MNNIPRRPGKDAVYCGRRGTPGTMPYDVGRFSPMLASLLSCAGSGGLAQRSFFSMLADVYPYACGSDRHMIRELLEADHQAADVLCRPARSVPIMAMQKRALTERERMLGMMRVLKKYADKRACDAFSLLERYLDISDRFSKSSGGIDELSILLKLLGADGPAAGMADMMRMAQTFSSMGGFGKNS